MSMPSTALKQRVTLEAYLAFENSAEEKHILWDGEIFPMWGMAGGSLAHNTISMNLATEVGAVLRGHSCRPFSSDQKIWVPFKQGVVYPDLSIVCGGVAVRPGTTDVIVNPSVIFEVLSPGTESFDRAEKFEGYRSIVTLRHYVMVASARVAVEHYTRSDDGAWTLRDLGADAVVTLSPPDITLRVADLYARAFDATA